MTESGTQNKNSRLMSQKSIPEHITDGSIGIDSIEAFGSILKQYPNHPGLLKKYSDLLFRQDLHDLAAKSYGEAAQLFIESGKMLQALVAKKLQWLIKPPTNKEIHQFLSALDQGSFDDSPLKIFFEKLSAREKLAIISGFVRVGLIAGKTVIKSGERDTDLYFVVSGTLKDSVFPSIDTKQKVYRKSDIYLSDDDFWGDVYPFNRNQASTSEVATVTQVELVKISKQKLVRICRQYPNVERALSDLFKIRAESGIFSKPKMFRKASRFQMPMKMILELPPWGPFKTPIAIEGYSSDISISGICVVLNGSSEHVPYLLNALSEIDDQKKIRVSFPGATMELKVRGNIIWNHEIQFNGKKTLAVGIQFEEDSPKMCGMLFMFAKSLGRVDKLAASE
jgi:hypothetical protein